MTHRNLPTAARVLVLALAYFVAGRLGLMLPAFGSHITLIWLPTGIAVAALLRWSISCWPGVALGALAVNFATGLAWPAVVGVAVGNTAGPLLTVWMLRRSGFHAGFDRQRDILLLAAAAALGMIFSASGGVAALVMGGVLPSFRLTAWLTWWAGDTMGVIAAAPLLLSWTRAEWRAVNFRRAEFFIWAGVTAASAYGVFVGNSGLHSQALALAFLPLPLVAWAALRFGAVGTSLAITALAVGAAYGTATERGPFARADPIESVVLLWLFMATSAVLGWLVTALHVARLRATGLHRLFEQALTDVSLGVLLADLDRKITYANAGFTRLTGYTEAELLGKSCRILQGPETDPMMPEKLRKELHGDGFFDGEILNYRKDGTTFWNGLLISPVHNERGEMTGFLAIQRNITKRREAELALRRSESRFRTLFENADDAIFLMEGPRFIECNARTLAIFGCQSRDQIVGHPPYEFSPPRQPDGRDSTESAMEKITAALAGQPQNFEWIHTKLDGTPFPAEVTLNRVELADKVCLQAIVRDITERQRTASALRTAAEFTKSLIGSMQDGFAVLDAKGVQSDANPSFCQMTGFAREELIGAHAPYPYWPPEEHQKIQAALTETMAGNVANFELIFMRRNGERFPVIVSPSAVKNQAGETISYCATVKDVTQLRQAEAAQQEVLARLQKIASQLPGMVYQFRLRPDGTSCFPFASEAIREIYRVSPEEVREDAAPVIAALHPDDAASIIAAMHASASGLTPWRHEHRVRFSDGTVRWLYGNALPQREADGATLWHGFTSDITERKQAQHEREALDRKVQETQKLESLGVLAGGIAHDFNNLLTGILGNASLASMDLPPGSPLHDYLEPINEASLRAADLCRQMLAYSGRGRFVVQRLDLGQLVEETAQMLQVSISKKAVLRFHLEKGLPSLEADATQLRQIIMNLVINASEAIGDKSGVIALSTGLTRLDRAYFSGALMATELPEGEYVFLEVSDNGSGMNAETQARIFDPFFTTKFTGRGLGLAAVLGIVRGHKGAMKVYSELGRGTTFKLLFPAASGPSEAATERPAASERWRGCGTVLVVDDEETIRSTVARMLTLTGFDPVIVADGREAVEVFRADPGRFALVLLDLTMPHMDGEETFTELRRLRADVRVVLMSGFNEQESLVRFPGKGLASFLQKPFTIEELRAVLQRVLV